MLRVFIALLPSLFFALVITIPAAIYVAYQKGFFRPKSIMIRNPSSGNYTRIHLDEIQGVELTEGVECTLEFTDGSRMSIKSEDAKRIMRWLPIVD